MNRGCVYLVGAGCGAADLITCRGMALLRRCGAVVYDDLIDPALLALPPKAAQRIYMGKRCGKHSASQAEISETLIDLARQGLEIVRLKGGDPFVFGRGGEEILALQQAGIAYEEVPGISSAIAIPAAAGIPVTHRGLSRSLHIITGHTADTPDGLPADLELLAQTSGTLVFLMGLGRLEAIARRLMEGGKSPDTPAAVISGGNAPNPAVVRAPLDKIAQKAAAVLPPAVIVVGDVAALDLSATHTLPLQGINIGITGTRSVTAKLHTELTQLGACVHPVLPMEVQDLPITHSFASIPDWLVFTSTNGVDRFFRHLEAQRMDLRRFSLCKFAVIGPATAAALARRGIQADLCPQVHTTQALMQALLASVPNSASILLFRSAQGDPELLRGLVQAGYEVTDVPAYDVQPDHAAVETMRCVLPRLDYLTFSSAGGVAQFFHEYGSLPEQVRCVCIGAVTARTLRRHSDRPMLIAEEISTHGLICAILRDHTAAKV